MKSYLDEIYTVPDFRRDNPELSNQAEKALQCYASYNQKPSEEILHYVNKVWLPYANKHLKQIQTAA